MRANRSIKLLWVGDGAWAHGLAVDAWEAALNVQRFGGNWNEVAALPGQALADPTRDHVAPQVIMTGLVPPERVPAFIRAMDVLAHPSYREGLPRTVPQALLCGVPPVAYDADGTGEVCRDMETGRLVPVGKWEALAAAILWMKDHPRERAAMAERGREECREAFSAERMVAELERVYARALSLARGGEG
jgi:glycosyltransferase involved in cell wall biosynthesis